MSVAAQRELLKQELAQRAEEGGDPTPFADQLDALAELDDDAALRACDALWTLLETIPVTGGHPEPSDLAGIRAARRDGPRTMDPPSGDTLQDKVLGALLGRIAGCQLGKPVEGWHKSAIDAYLALAGESEIRDYLPYVEDQPDTLPRKLGLKGCCRGRLQGALRDDDQDYTILGLLLLKRHGTDLTPGHVADAWLELLPFHKVYTAERETYRNLINGLRPPACATYRHPYREWIGAQIRADGWAYASAGRPQQAAEYAWRDASISHVKNGIYGEMMYAAAIAGACCVDTPLEALRIGLSEIPAECRLTECLEDVIAWWGQGGDWRACWSKIDAKYGGYHWVHTINNAALVAMGLLYGDGDLGATIGIAVHGGWDTDCNGATAGSVLGAILGAKALPELWTAPLQNSAQSALFGYAENQISDLAGLAVGLNETVILG